MVPWHGKALRAMLKVPDKTVNLKYRGGAIIEHALFDPAKKFSFEK